MNGSSPRIGVDIVTLSEGILAYITEEASIVATTLMSLSPLTTYRISVYVVSSVGRSHPSSINSSTLSLSKTYLYML